MPNQNVKNQLAEGAQYQNIIKLSLELSSDIVIFFYIPTFDLAVLEGKRLPDLGPSMFHVSFWQHIENTFPLR